MKILKWLDEHFEEYILLFLSIFTVVIIFSQVVMRYVFSNSLPWSEEIARYAFIWMIYVGVSYGVKKNKHLGVDALKILFAEKGKLIIGMIANISFLVFAVVMAYFGFDIVLRVTRISAALSIPLGWVYASTFVGFTLTSIRLVQNIILEAKALKDLKKNSYQYEIESKMQEEVI